LGTTKERILLIAKNNETLREILLRVNKSEIFGKSKLLNLSQIKRQESNYEFDFSAKGRINYMLSDRIMLLKKVK
jgi:hypothetical protein